MDRIFRDGRVLAVVLFVLAALLLAGCATKKGARKDEGSAAVTAESTESDASEAETGDTGREETAAAVQGTAGAEEVRAVQASGRESGVSAGGRSYDTSTSHFSDTLMRYLALLVSPEFWQDILSQGWEATVAFFHTVAVFFANPATA